MILTKELFALFGKLNPQLIFRRPLQAGPHGLDDLTVLELAALEHRLLVSSDQSTMPIYFSQFIEHQVSAGLLIVPKTVNLEFVAKELLLVWTASEAEEWVNRIAFLPL